MSRLIITLLIILTTSPYLKGKATEDILERLKEKTKSYNNVTIDFNLIFEYQSIKENQQGRLILAGNKFKLILDDQTIINNGKTQWIHLSDFNEVQIMNSPEDNLFSPNRIFDISKEDYRFDYIRTNTKNLENMQIIDAFPKESTNLIKITMTISTKKEQLKNIKVYDKNGGIYTYIITSFRSNSIIKSFDFNIEDFPGIEVIDLR